MQNIEKHTAITPELQAELEKRLTGIAKDGRVQCSSALAISRSLGIPAAEIGKSANKLKLKISKCQLGCF